MNTRIKNHEIWNYRWASTLSIKTKLIATLTALGLVVASSQTASAQVFRDSFDSYSTRADLTNGGWRTIDMAVVGSPASYTFPPSLTGKSFRLFAPGVASTAAGPARAFMYRNDIYGDFTVYMDVLKWNDGINQAFGLLARIQPNPGLGATTGYVINWNPNQGQGSNTNGLPAGTNPGGQFQINRILNENPTTIAVASISLDTNKQYRFVATGDQATATISGMIYDLEDLSKPIVTITAPEGTYAQGLIGVFNFSRVNTATQTNPNFGQADMTIDNYLVVPQATVVAPFGASLRIAHSLEGHPQIQDRVPLTRTNFYNHTGELSFKATTLSTTNNINDSSVKLILNGFDATSGLVFSGPATNRTVAYNALCSNTVYNVNIIVGDVLGRTYTNLFTFDTFSQDYLESASVKVIEAEDYNYGNDGSGVGGNFQNNPPPSGFDTNGGQVNGFGVGYLDLQGQPNVDYFDWATTFGSGVNNSYRLLGNDRVGTRPGLKGADYPDLLPNAGLFNDTFRTKYTNGAPDYQLHLTEHGEWLNYTRTFTSNKYNVYLRVASRAKSQAGLTTIRLGEVTSDRTLINQTVSPLGNFICPHDVFSMQFRYVPLVDDGGKLRDLTLDGTKTLRMTFGDTASTNWFMKASTYPNYILVVPVKANPPATTIINPALVGNEFRLTFATQPCAKYTVQWANAVTGDVWTSMSPSILGDGNPKSATNITTVSTRYFRVISEPFN